LSFMELNLSGSPSAQREVVNIRRVAQARYEKAQQLRLPILNAYENEYNTAKTLYEFKTGKPYTLNLNNYVLENIFVPDVVQDEGRSFGKKSNRPPFFSNEDIESELKRQDRNEQNRPYRQADILMFIDKRKRRMIEIERNPNNSQEEIDFLQNKERLITIKKLKNLGIRDIKPEYRF